LDIPEENLANIRDKKEDLSIQEGINSPQYRSQADNIANN